MVLDCDRTAPAPLRQVDVGESVITPRQIRAARALLGWSQAELSERTSVARPTLNRIENGLSDPHASTLRRIEEALLEAGIEPIDAGHGKGEGVRLAKAD